MQALGLAVLLIMLSCVNTAVAQWKNVAPNLMTGNKHRIGWGGAITYCDGSLWVAVTHQLFQSPDTGKTWKLIQNPASNQSNLIIYDIDFIDKDHGVVAAGQHGILTTNDGGLTWTQLFPPWFNGGLSIINQAKFVSNARTFIVSDQLSGNSITTDGGINWRSVTPAGVPVESTNHILVRRSNNQIVLLDAIPNDQSCIFTSNDNAASWQRSPSTFYYDCYGLALDSCNESTFHIVNEATLFTAADRFARLLKTTDGGITFNSINETNSQYYCGSIVCAPLGTLYVQSRMVDGVLRSVDHGTTWHSIGGPPGYSDSHLICPISDNILAAVDTFGSVWVTTNSGGDSLVALINDDVTITTKDQKADTIGQEVRLPIVIDDLDKPRTVDVLVIFDSSLEYRGSFSLSGQSVDIPGTQGKDRVSIKVPVQQNGAIAAYAVFRTFPLSDIQPQVHFIPATFANGILPCGLQINAHGATATVTVPTGCGIPTISRFMRFAEMPGLVITPNPANTLIEIGASEDISDARISITDVGGRTLYTTIQPIKKMSRLSVDTRTIPSGAYFLNVHIAAGDITRSIIIEH